MSSGKQLESSEKAGSDVRKAKVIGFLRRMVMTFGKVVRIFGKPTRIIGKTMRILGKVKRNVIFSENVTRDAISSIAIWPLDVATYLVSKAISSLQTDSELIASTFVIGLDACILGRKGNTSFSEGYSRISKAHICGGTLRICMPNDQCWICILLI